jgi:hypothetical protein
MTTKEHATLIISGYRVCLSRLAIVVSAESAKDWVSKFSVASKDDACIANEQKESDELDHLDDTPSNWPELHRFDPRSRGRLTRCSSRILVLPPQVAKNAR